MTLLFCNPYWFVDWTWFFGHFFHLILKGCPLCYTSPIISFIFSTRFSLFWEAIQRVIFITITEYSHRSTFQVQYISWSSAFALIPIILSSLGIILTGITLAGEIIHSYRCQLCVIVIDIIWLIRILSILTYIIFSSCKKSWDASSEGFRYCLGWPKRPNTEREGVRNQSPYSLIF